jgi:hypothetical protein
MVKYTKKVAKKYQVKKEVVFHKRKSRFKLTLYFILKLLNPQFGLLKLTTKFQKL